MPHITVREGVRGREFIFRHNGKLYAFKTRAEAEIRYNEMNGMGLF